MPDFIPNTPLRQGKPLDEWTFREKLFLVAAICKSEEADPDWMAISDAMKPFRGPDRPDWMNPNHCAKQYFALLRHFGISGNDIGETERPAERLRKKLDAEREILLKNKYKQLQKGRKKLVDKWSEESDEEEFEREVVPASLKKRNWKKHKTQQALESNTTAPLDISGNFIDDLANNIPVVDLLSEEDISFQIMANNDVFNSPEQHFQSDKNGEVIIDVEEVTVESEIEMKIEKPAPVHNPLKKRDRTEKERDREKPRIKLAPKSNATAPQLDKNREVIIDVEEVTVESEIEMKIEKPAPVLTPLKKRDRTEKERDREKPRIRLAPKSNTTAPQLDKNGEVIIDVEEVTVESEIEMKIEKPAPVLTPLKKRDRTEKERDREKPRIKLAPKSNATAPQLDKNGEVIIDVEEVTVESEIEMKIEKPAPVLTPLKKRDRTEKERDREKPRIKLAPKSNATAPQLDKNGEVIIDVEEVTVESEIEMKIEKPAPVLNPLKKRDRTEKKRDREKPRIKLAPRSNATAPQLDKNGEVIIDVEEVTVESEIEMKIEKPAPVLTPLKKRDRTEKERDREKPRIKLAPKSNATAPQLDKNGEVIIDVEEVTVESEIEMKIEKPAPVLNPLKKRDRTEKERDREKPRIKLAPRSNATAPPSLAAVGLRREPTYASENRVDEWSLTEKLYLVCEVCKSKENLNWMAISTAIKPHAEPNRPNYWMNHENCATQYYALLKDFGMYGRESRNDNGETEKPAAFILKQLIAERKKQIGNIIVEKQAENEKIQKDKELLQSRYATGDIDVEELGRQQASRSLLKKRDSKKQKIQQAPESNATAPQSHTAVDEWSLSEKLSLVSAICEGDTDPNWMAISCAIKYFAEPNRPNDWMSPENCATQYHALQRDFGMYKTESRNRKTKRPAVVIRKKLEAARIAQLKNLMAGDKSEYDQLQEDIDLLQSGCATEDQIDKWCQEIDEEELRKEQVLTSLKKRDKKKKTKRDRKKQTIQQAPESIATAPPSFAEVGLRQFANASEYSFENEKYVKLEAIVPSPTTQKSYFDKQQQDPAKPVLTDPSISLSQIQNVPPLDISDDVIDDLAKNVLGIDIQSGEVKEFEDNSFDIMANTNYDIFNNPERYLQLDGNGEVIMSWEIDDLEVTEPEPIVEVEKENGPVDNRIEMEMENLAPVVGPFELQKDIVLFESPVKQHLKFDKNMDDWEIDELEVNEPEPIVEVEKENGPVENRIEMEIEKLAPVVGPFELQKDTVLFDSPVEQHLKLDKIMDDITEGEIDELEVNVPEPIVEVEILASVVGPFEGRKDIVLFESPVEQHLKLDKNMDDITDGKIDELEVNVPEPIVEVEILAPVVGPFEIQKDIVLFDSPVEQHLKLDTNRDDIADGEIDDLEETEPEPMEIENENGPVETKIDMEIDKSAHVDDSFEIRENLIVLLTPLKQDNVPSNKKSLVKSDKKGIEAAENPVANDSVEIIEIDSDEDEVIYIHNDIEGPEMNTKEQEVDDKKYQNWKESVMQVYNRLLNDKLAPLFLKPMTGEEAASYSNLIYRPVNLLTIKEKIDSGIIKTSLEFKRDVMLMFQNAIMYMKTNSKKYKEVLKMQQKSLDMIESVLQAEEKVEQAERVPEGEGECQMKEEKRSKNEKKNVAGKVEQATNKTTSTKYKEVLKMQQKSLDMIEMSVLMGEGKVEKAERVPEGEGECQMKEEKRKNEKKNVAGYVEQATNKTTNKKYKEVLKMQQKSLDMIEMSVLQPEGKVEQAERVPEGEGGCQMKKEKRKENKKIYVAGKVERAPRDPEGERGCPMKEEKRMGNEKKYVAAILNQRGFQKEKEVPNKGAKKKGK